MTCSKSYGRLLQASCLGLIGALAIAGCGSSSDETKNNDGGDTKPAQTPAALSISKPSGAFGTVAVGAASTTTVDFDITNTGGAASGVPAVAFTGPFSGAGCTTALPANGGKCTVKVTFTPVAAGDATGTMTVSATPGGAVSATLTGSGTKGALTFNPPTFDLGTVAIGATKSGQVVLSNSGTGAATPLAVAVTGADFTVDTTTTTCGASLDAGKTCVVGYTFAPKSKGDKTAQVSATATGSSAVAIVTAKVPGPAALTISPTAAPLSAKIGADSAAFTFTVANAGEAATGALDIKIAGTDAANFRITDNKCTSLAARDYCTVGVVFNSAKAGKSTAKITVTDTTAATVTTSADLTGTANETKLSITGGPDMGSIELGKKSAPVVFTVTNAGGSTEAGLVVTSDNSEFAIVANQCTGKDLAPAATCTVSIQFAPSALGVRTATLTAKGTSTGMLTITGTGTPVAAALLVMTPATWDFGQWPTNQTSAAKEFVVTNNGLATSGALTFATTGAAAASFVTTSTCNAGLKVGETCKVTVTFKPALAQPMAATVSVTDGVTTGSAALSGTGTAPANISFKDKKNLVPSTGCFQNLFSDWDQFTVAAQAAQFVDYECNGHAADGFDPVVVGDANAVASTTTFTVVAGDASTGFSETGAITAAFGGDAAADFSVGLNTCVASLPAGQSCTIQVKFAPKATTGLRSATFTVTSALGGQAVAQLYAYARPFVEIYPVGGAAVTVTLPTAATPKDGLAFPDQTLGTTSSSMGYWVTVWGSTAANKYNPVTVTLPRNSAGLADDFSFATNSCTATATTATAYKCPVTVTFNPQNTLGDKSAALTATGANGGTASKTLTGKAVGPLKIVPTVDTIPQFGNVNVGVASTPLSLTLKNTGAVGLGPVALTLTGAEMAIVDDGCTTSGTLAANTSCVVKLVVIPTSAGAKTGSISATAGSQTASYDLSATAATIPGITVSPMSTATTPVSFNSVAVGAKGDWQVFTVTNPAAVATNEVQYSVTGNFELAPDAEQGTCGATGTTRLPSNGTCTIKARFAPADGTSLGLRTGTLVVFVTTPASSVTVNLSGMATSAISVSPTSLTFDPIGLTQLSAAKTITVTNRGAASIAVTPTLSSTVGTEFVISGGNCSATAATTLTAGASCTFDVKAVGALAATTPNLYPAPTSATISLTAGAGGSKQIVNLAGSVVTLADIVAPEYASTSINLGSAVYAQGSTNNVTVTVKNQGLLAATSLSAQWCNGGTCADTDPNFAVKETSACLSAATLAGGATCTIVVGATPQAAGAVTRTLRLRYNNGSDIVTVTPFTFSATGRAASTNALAPSSYTFAGTTVAGIDSTATATFTFTDVTAAQQPIFGTPAVDSADFYVMNTSTCSGTLPASGTCYVYVKFKPVDDSATSLTVNRVGTVTISIGTTAQNKVDYTAGVIGVMARPAKLVVTNPGPFTRTGANNYNDFGQVLTGVASSALTFTVTNVGDASTVNPVTMAISGTNSGLFSRTTTCEGALAAHGTCSVYVKVTPTAAGAFGDNTTILTVSAASLADATSLAMRGTAVKAAELHIDVTSKNFGSVGVLSPSCYTMVTALNGVAASTDYTTTSPLVASTNRADYEVVFSKPADTANCPTYATLTPNCDQYRKDDVNNLSNTGLPSGQTCAMWVRFRPLALTTDPVINGTLTVAGAVETGVSMTGTVVAALSASVTGTTITVKNAVGAPTTGPLTTALSSAGFRIVTDGCVGQTLDGGETCTVTVANVSTTACKFTVSGTPGNSAEAVLQ